MRWPARSRPLVVLEHPFERATEPAAALVGLLDVDLGHELVDLRRGRQRAGECQRTADADWLRLRPGQARGRGQAGSAGAEDATAGDSRCIHDGLLMVF